VDSHNKARGTRFGQNFRAEHRDHLRTSNPIERVLATVCHPGVRPKGALSAMTAKLMVFKLVTAAAKTWRRLAVLYDILARKNRINTVTISRLELLTRCQCSNIAATEPWRCAPASADLGSLHGRVLLSQPTTGNCYLRTSPTMYQARIAKARLDASATRKSRPHLVEFPSRRNGGNPFCCLSRSNSNILASCP
jgi:hypothetical protein